MSGNARFILAINCGSSSIKAKLFELGGEGNALTPVADLTVKNIAAKGEKVKFKITWEKNGWGSELEDEGEEGSEVDCELGLEFDRRAFPSGEVINFCHSQIRACRRSFSRSLCHLQRLTRIRSHI
jgi:hypothetical protein